ncbi:hypothetical protein LSAT2_022084 [Lamellibrachia satsuma]|nr:hypothetical protein LSAT2_022084 [Lamellibrachia satsuma]
MDGSENTRIVTSSSQLTRDIAINYKHNMICWTDAWRKTIECSNYDGSNVQVHNVGGSTQYLQVEDGIVYYTQWQSSGVHSINLNGGARATIDMGSYNGLRPNGIVLLCGKDHTAEIHISLEDSCSHHPDPVFDTTWEEFSNMPDCLQRALLGQSLHDGDKEGSHADEH